MCPCCRFQIVVLIGCLTFGTCHSSSALAQAADDVARPGTVPAADDVKGLIRELAKIDGPGLGFSPTMTGVGFAPIPSANDLQTLMFTNHGLKESRALLRLVELGSEAVPALLDSLDDKTPTKYVVKHESLIGGMWFDEDEKVGKGFERHITEYTVTVGDICYVILGQITDQPYMAVRYQRTACTVILSPARNPELVASLRKEWGGDEHARILRESLTKRAKSGDSGALVRVGYYYPKESESLLLDWLSRIDWMKKKTETEQLSVAHIVEAIAVSRSAAVQAQIVKIMQQTPRLDYFVATLAGLGQAYDTAILTRSKELLAALPDETGEGGALLGMIRERFPNEAKSIFREFGNSQSLARRQTLCARLWWGDLLAQEVLPPFLDDKRELPGRSKSWRICDDAAQAISLARKDIDFNGDAPIEKRDQQIAQIKRTLSAE